MVVYIDDILVLAGSKQLIEDQVSGLVYFLECLGFMINKKKSILEPTQSLDFLGVVVDTTSMELKLPGERFAQK